MSYLVFQWRPGFVADQAGTVSRRLFLSFFSLSLLRGRLRSSGYWQAGLRSKTRDVLGAEERLSAAVKS